MPYIFLSLLPFRAKGVCMHGARAYLQYTFHGSEFYVGEAFGELTWIILSVWLSNLWMLFFTLLTELNLIKFNPENPILSGLNVVFLFG